AVGIQETRVESSERTHIELKNVRRDSLLAIDVAVGEQRSQLRAYGNSERFASSTPFADLESSCAGRFTKKGDLSRLPQVKDNVVRPRQAAVANEEAHQPKQRCGGKVVTIERQRCPRAHPPVRCSH